MVVIEANELDSLKSQRQELTRRLDRLSGQAAAKAEAYIESRGQLLAAEAFLDLAPQAAARLEDLTRELFGEEDVLTFECMERELTRSKRGTRPSTRVSHTGYLTVCRKL